MTLTLSVGTANIKNYPDMTPAQVEQDMETVHKHNLDLVLWQEIGEQADFNAIIKAFGNDEYGSTDTYSGKKGRGYVGGNVITWKRDVLSKVGDSTLVQIGKTMGEGTAHPSQWMAGMTFKSVTDPDLPLIDVYDIHFIVGAHNAETKPFTIKHKQELLERWNGDHAALKKAALASQAKGHICIFGGDWNASGNEIPKFSKDHLWIVNGVTGIDHIGILLPPSVQIKVDGKSAKFNLNSDHDLKTRTIHLTAGKADPAPVDPAQRPDEAQRAVDAMANARDHLEALGKAGGAWGVRALSAQKPLQRAINTLLGA